MILRKFEFFILILNYDLAFNIPVDYEIPFQNYSNFYTQGILRSVNLNKNDLKVP